MMKKKSAAHDPHARSEHAYVYSLNRIILHVEDSISIVLLTEVAAMLVLMSSTSLERALMTLMSSEGMNGKLDNWLRTSSTSSLQSLAVMAPRTPATPNPQAARSTSKRS